MKILCLIGILFSDYMLVTNPLLKFIYKKDKWENLRIFLYIGIKHEGLYRI